MKSWSNICLNVEAVGAGLDFGLRSIEVFVYSNQVTK